MTERSPTAAAAAERASGVYLGGGAAGLKVHARLSGARVGRYRLGARLGVGGAASVYLARLSGPHAFERIAAVKVIHEHLVDEPEFVSMFLDEARLAARLSHPNVVHVYELGRDGEVLFLAMEHLDGQPLSQVYRALAARGGELPVDVLAHVGARAAEGLHHAHRLIGPDGEPVSLVHRDVSPENVFVTYDGHVKVIDFGIARAVGRLTTTALGHVKGKYRYMAPEQALGRELDHRVDIFALGATLAEGVLGRPVFDGADDADTLGRVLQGVPAELFASCREVTPSLAELLHRCLAQEPEGRPQTAGELARDLDLFVQRSGRADQRERLAEILDTVFSAERDQLAEAVAALRVLDETSADEAVVAPPASRPAASTSGRPLRLLLLVGVTAALVTAAVLLGLAGRRQPEPQRLPAAASVSRDVLIDVVLEPPGPAQITIAGALVEERPARRRVPRAESAVTVEVIREGAAPVTLTVVPDRDRAVVVPRAPAGVALAASPSAMPTALTSSSAVGPRAAPRAAPREGPPGASALPGASAPPPVAGLVTEYPF